MLVIPVPVATGQVELYAPRGHKSTIRLRILIILLSSLLTGRVRCPRMKKQSRNSSPAWPAGPQFQTGDTTMTTLVRWDPFSDFRKTVRMFDESFTRPRRFVATAPSSSFPVEVSETDGDFEIKAALPGVDPEKVEISVQDDVLTIRGSHEEETENKQREFYRRE